MFVYLDWEVPIQQGIHLRACYFLRYFNPPIQEPSWNVVVGHFKANIYIYIHMFMIIVATKKTAIHDKQIRRVTC